MKSLLKLFALMALLALPASAATTVTHNINQTWPGTNLYSRGLILYSLTVQVTNATANIPWALFDSSSSTVSSSLTYTNTTYTLGNFTNIITTPGGVSQTNVYSNIITTTNQTLSSVTLNKAKLATATSTSNTTTTITFTDPLFFTQGLTITNQGGLGPITLVFDPAF